MFKVKDLVKTKKGQVGKVDKVYASFDNQLRIHVEFEDGSGVTYDRLGRLLGFPNDRGEYIEKLNIVL